jgi:hypothetical protein
MLPAIDGKRDPGDSLRLREIDNGGRNIVRRGAPLKRQTLSLRSKLYIGLARTRQSRTRRHRVYPNPRRQRLGQRDRGCMQRGLAQGVGEKARSWPENTLVKNVHDRSIKAGGRLRCKSLRKKQRRGEVHSDGALEASRRERLDVIRLEFAGTVDQEGQRSERR